MRAGNTVQKRMRARQISLGVVQIVGNKPVTELNSRQCDMIKSFILFINLTVYCKTNSSSHMFMLFLRLTQFMTKLSVTVKEVCLLLECY